MTAAASGWFSAGVDSTLREHGRAIPRDMAVVGFDNWEIIAAQSRPPLTTIDMNLHDLGRSAAEHLLAQLEGTKESGLGLLPCSLAVRESA